MNHKSCPDSNSAAHAPDRIGAPDHSHSDSAPAAEARAVSDTREPILALSAENFGIRQRSLVMFGTLPLLIAFVPALLILMLGHGGMQQINVERALDAELELLSLQVQRLKSDAQRLAEQGRELVQPSLSPEPENPQNPGASTRFSRALRAIFNMNPGLVRATVHDADGTQILTARRLAGTDLEIVGAMAPPEAESILTNDESTADSAYKAVVRAAGTATETTPARPQTRFVASLLDSDARTLLEIFLDLDLGTMFSTSIPRYWLDAEGRPLNSETADRMPLEAAPGWREREASRASTWAWLTESSPMLWRELVIDPQAFQSVWIGRAVPTPTDLAWWKLLKAPLLAALGLLAIMLTAVTLVARRVFRRAAQTQEDLVTMISRQLRSGDDSTPDDVGAALLGLLSEDLGKFRKDYIEARVAKRKAELALAEARNRVAQTSTTTITPPPVGEDSIRLILESVPKAIFGIDQKGQCTFCNPAALSALGFAREDKALGQRPCDITPDELWPNNGQTDQRKAVHVQESQFIRADGSTFPAEYWSFPIINRGIAVGAVLSFVDISERKAAESALLPSDDTPPATSVSDAILTTDSRGRIRALNPVAEALLGHGNDAAQGMAFSEVFRALDSSTRKPKDDLFTCSLRSNAQGDPRASLILLRPDNSEIEIEYTTSPIRNRDGGIGGIIVVFRRLSGEDSGAVKTGTQEGRDQLTGLLTRAEFEQRLQRVLDRNDRTSNPSTVGQLDIDQFRIINETCGYTAGDELLRQLAAILKQNLRHRDSVARLGGDEFSILLEHCPMPKAQEIARQVQDAVHRFRFIFDGRSFSLRLRIGLVGTDEVAGDSEDLLHAAQQTCLQAKQSDSKHIEIYQGGEEHTIDLHRDLRAAQEIEQALDQNRLKLFFQQMISVLDVDLKNPMQHVEILVRMEDEEGRLTLPGAFLPAAERANMIGATDRWVIQEAFRWLAERPTAAAPESMSLNLSTPTVADNRFPAFVLEQLESSGVAPDRVRFEITEAAIAANPAQAQRLMRELKATGFHFTMDDFSNGISSFSYLKSFPFDYLKIEGTLIKDIDTDPAALSIVKSINEVGHIMGKRTVAKHVENDVILEMLRDVGIDYVQGYAISKPKPLVLLGYEPTRLAG